MLSVLTDFDLNEKLDHGKYLSRRLLWESLFTTYEIMQISSSNMRNSQNLPIPKYRK